MYERSAIVLERYFNNVLGYSSENNLKVNFDNFCSLVGKLAEYQECYKQEQTAIQEFDNVTERLNTIQKNQEKLYKKSAKLEFNRNLLFNNIEDKPENIERCMTKIENDVDKNKEAFKTAREDFITTLKEFNEKKKVLNRAKKERKEAEKAYKEVLEISIYNVENINEFTLELARNFNGAEIKEKVVNLMRDNGKNEKIPFDETVINQAVDLGLDVAQKEAQCYVEIYDNILRVFDEIERNDVRIEKFKKRMRNVKVKLDFLFAEKEYIVQFLDYERIISVNGIRTYKKLIGQACENFELDVIQINNLYELILKEIAYKSSKKLYKELYNKTYLLDIYQKEATFKKEKTKVSLNVGTVLGSNYWRIEGIKNIYTEFYRIISEEFEKDLDEFDVPDEEDETDVDVEIIEEVEVKKATKKVVSKKENIVEASEEILEEELPQLIFEEDEEIQEIAEVAMEAEESIEETVEAAVVAEDVEDIKENVQKIEIEEAEEFEEEYEEDNDEDEDDSDAIFEEIDEEDIPYEDDDQEYEMEDEEESLFGNIKSIRNTRETVKNLDALEKLEEEKKASKKGIFKSIMKMNSKNGKKIANE